MSESLRERMLLCFATVIGAVVGSFLNVCIYRLPWNKSIIWPASHCPNCLRPIRGFDNVPILSWWILKGRCRDCGTAFSPRYMLIELFTAFSFGFLFWLERPAAMPEYWRFALHAVLLSLLIVATFIDWDLQIIPDSVTVPGMFIGLISSLFALGKSTPQLVQVTQPSIDLAQLAFSDQVVFGVLIAVGWAFLIGTVVWQWRNRRQESGGQIELAEAVIMLVAAAYLVGQTAVLGQAWGWWAIEQPWPGWPDWLTAHPRWASVATSVIGFLAGWSIIWFVRVVGTAAFRKEAMGFGDVTLMAMVGAFLGWQPIVFIFFLAPFFGLIVGLVQLATRGENVMAFGPYLAMGTALVMLSWDWLWPRAQLQFGMLGLIPAPWGIGVVVAVLFACLLRNARMEQQEPAT